MQIYYRDHPEAGGYLYVALRAPNDAWNGFYDVYVYPRRISGNGEGVPSGIGIPWVFSIIATML